jgi:hypothetical protein
MPGLTIIFWADGLGVEDNLHELRQVSILRHVIYFCVAEPKMVSTYLKPRTSDELEKQT